MNTEIQNSSPAEADANSVSRRNGNVARLSKPIRDKINSMLDDGITYAEIITALGDDGKHLQISNISRWKDGGYQDYLRDQAWRERLDTNANRYLEVGITDGTKLAAGGLYAASVQICKLIDELANPNADETDPDKCSRVTNALSRLSRSILQLQQYRDAIDRQKAADPASPEAREKARLDFLDSMDQLFGIRPPKRKQPVASGVPPDVKPGVPPGGTNPQ